MTDVSAEDEARKRRGRRIAFTIFYGLVVAFTLTAAAQISVQVYSSPAPWQGDCKGGLRALARGVDEARSATEGAGLEPEEALRRFRQALGAAWNARDGVDRVCRATGDKVLLDAFDTIERLRYAEENAVRREGNDLTPLRRRQRGLLAGPLAEPPP